MTWFSFAYSLQQLVEHMIQYRLHLVHAVHQEAMSDSEKKTAGTFRPCRQIKIELHYLLITN
ncbi:hypothetical protein E6C60_2824 [Paenibacillus algicola]|uniref:Uncharacterized protein n=1 Tax=Paenibacillus algicola TaxID=2565926 RepID=A0A4P8XLC4_9BACL|nr:hypothetical protein E6C60_2824 [Paenibacillus algicola]